jgi:hypothetical protein
VSELVARFEDCSLPSSEFHHAEHVRVAWEYLREEPSAVDALRRFATNLRRFADHHGASTLYHETITWAYLALIRERMERDPGADWTAFAEANGDLLTWKPSILERYYTSETLFSDLARRAFVLPDKTKAAAEAAALEV